MDQQGQEEVIHFRAINLKTVILFVYSISISYSLSVMTGIKCDFMGDSVIRRPLDAEHSGAVGYGSYLHCDWLLRDQSVTRHYSCNKSLKLYEYLQILAGACWKSLSLLVIELCIYMEAHYILRVKKNIKVFLR